MILARQDLYLFVIDNTPLLNDPKYQISTKCNWILNDIYEFPRCTNPLCEVEGGKIFDGNVKVHDKYPTQCRRCNNRTNSPRTLHAREINFDRFGSYTNMGTELFKLQAIEGFLQRYGTTNNMKSELGKAEYCAAIQEKYNVKWIAHVPEIQSKMKSKFTYDNRTFDSGIELALYIYLKDNNVNFRYNDFNGIPYVYDNKTYYYFKDFECYINGIVYSVEIKGAHFFNSEGKMHNPYDHTLDLRYEAKQQCMLNNDINIIKDSSICMQYLYKYIDDKYGKNYLWSFKNCNKSK